MQNSTMINRKFVPEQRSIVSRILPVLLFLSFIWLNLYEGLTSFVPADGFSGGFLVLSILMSGLIYYLAFELCFYIYRLVLGFSIYSFMIPKRVLIDRFRFWYIIRNLCLGILFNLRFLVPYISTYLCVFEITFNFLFIIGLYFHLSKSYVEPLVGQFVFKTLSVPVIIYEVYEVIVLMVGVL